MAVWVARMFLWARRWANTWPGFEACWWNGRGSYPSGKSGGDWWLWETGAPLMFCFRLHWFQDHSPALLGEAHDFLWLAPFGTEQATNLSQKMSVCWRLSQQAPHTRGGRSHGSLETYLCVLEKKVWAKQVSLPPLDGRKCGQLPLSTRRGEKAGWGVIGFH